MVPSAGVTSTDKNSALSAEPEATTTHSDVTRVAGRGTVYITLAKVWFMLTGYATHFALARLMSIENYGLYQVVMGVVAIINAVITIGTSQTVSKYVSHDEASADSVKNAALRLQLLIGGGASLCFLLLAPVVSAYLRDPQLTNYLRLASLIPLAYSFYSVFVGYFNGQKRFLTQAGLDATYSTLKVFFILLLVSLGYGVGGGVGGFALAAGVVLVISAVVARRSHDTAVINKRSMPLRELAHFQIYLLGFTLVMKLLQKVDLILIKSLSSSNPQTASENAGYYGAAINLANITYQIIISMAFVVFPLVSRAAFEEDRARTRTYIANTLRYSLMIMAGVATLLSANATEAIRLVYKAEYEVAAPSLRIVAFGMLFFGVLFVATTIISASGRPSVSLLIGLVTLISSASLNAALIPGYGIAGAATATTAGMALGSVLCGSYLLSSFKALMSMSSLIRIVSCSALVYVVSAAVTASSRPLIVAKLVGVGIVYIAGLIATREIGSSEVSAARKVLGV